MASWWWQEGHQEGYDAADEWVTSRGGPDQVAIYTVMGWAEIVDGLLQETANLELGPWEIGDPAPSAIDDYEQGFAAGFEEILRDDALIGS